jgi:hypothetical protein
LTRDKLNAIDAMDNHGQRLDKANCRGVGAGGDGIQARRVCKDLFGEASVNRGSVK